MSREPAAWAARVKLETVRRSLACIALPGRLTDGEAGAGASAE
jgi:hypothetical protein